MSTATLTTQVEITISWGSSVVRTLTLCPPRAVQVGEGECAVPTEQLGGRRLPLLVVVDGEPRLVVWPGASGTATLRGERPRPIDRIVAEGGALPCRGARGRLAIPLPVGATAEVVLSRRGAQSVYRDRGGDDRVVLRVAVTRVPRRVRYRSLVVRYAAAASLALSLLAHFTVFATEPDPVLSPMVDPELVDRTASYSLPVTASALAQPEPDGDWDRVRAPLETMGDGLCVDGSGAACFASTGLWPVGEAVVVHTPERARATESYFDVPAELSSCFVGPDHGEDWLGAPRVEIARVAGGARPPSDGRLRRSVAGGEILGFLVVDDDEKDAPPGERSAEPFRAARPRHPRFAFGSPAVRVLQHGLDRAEPAFAWCYQRALQDHPNLSGRVAMRTAAPDGKGSVAAAGTEIADAGLQCCLANAQRLWTPRVHGSGELRYVLDLHRAR